MPTREELEKAFRALQREYEADYRRAIDPRIGNELNTEPNKAVLDAKRDLVVDFAGVFGIDLRA